MGCQCSKLFSTVKIDPKNRANQYVVSHQKENQSDPKVTIIVPPKKGHEGISNTLTIPDEYIGINLTPTITDHVDIISADSNAFNASFLQKRQAAIDKHSYRTTIDSWSPKTLQQLEGLIQTFTKDKPIIDQHWIIFYWIARNIEYDFVSFLNGTIPSQTVENVFNTKKSVCEGYSRLYKHLCDHIKIPCEKISGYSKGVGYEDDKKTNFSETDHAWNAVPIDEHWYLLDSTWGAGHLNPQNQFERELNTFYFLSPPEQIIFTHLPEEDRWQLLREPISKKQFIQMPQLKPIYFQLHLELISPRYQSSVSLIPQKSFAIVQIKAPPTVQLSGKLELNAQEIKGAVQLLYDRKRQLYNCFFAPKTVGRHEITIFGAEGIEPGTSLGQVMKLSLKVTSPLTQPISFPKIHQTFHNFDLQLISPVNTRVIEVSESMSQATIVIRAPRDVVLIGDLKKSGEENHAGEDIYYDQEKDVWMCHFSPEQSGDFEVCIYAKKCSDPGHYSAVIRFDLHATLNNKSSQSFAQLTQLFHQLNLELEKPKRGSGLVWPNDASFVDVILRAPDDVILICSLKEDQHNCENGALAQFDSRRQLWQFLFAPDHSGLFHLLIFAKQKNENGYTSVVQFRLNVPQIERPITFPSLFETFYSKKMSNL